MMELIEMKYIGKNGWTGKHDINGTKIQDGDIMSYSDLGKYPYHTDPYCVKWSDDLAGFECESSDNFMLATVWDKMAIIGNMRKNPELMEQTCIHNYKPKDTRVSDDRTEYIKTWVCTECGNRCEKRYPRIGSRKEPRIVM